jgi:outer membrane protein insertion porin family/translocation and assembly module TamA
MLCGIAQTAMPGARARFPFLLLVVALCVTGCREQGDIRIRSLHFNGVHRIDENALKGALVTKQGSKLPWGHKTYFDRRAFESDLERIRAFYLDRGFPDARVQSFDVQLNAAQTEVSVVVNISEGQPVTVDAIEMTGFEVLTAAQQRGLRDSLPLQPGQPLDRQLAVATRERALNVLRDEGYPYATVAMQPQETAPRKQTIVLTADPGVLAHIGVVDIRGAASVGDNVVRRQLTFKPGDRFTRKELRESQRKLYSMELFQFANIESLEDRDTMSAEVPVRVTVAEGKHRKITTGIGYGSEEKARARIRWDHLNFFGGARHAGFEARWSSLDRGIRLEYTEPYLFSPHFSLRFEGQAWQAREPAYSQDTLGGRFIVKHQSNQQWSWSVSLINEFETSSIIPEALTDFTVRNNLIALGLDPRTGETRGTVGALALDFNRNTTNNLLDATRGYVLNGHLEEAGRFMWGTYNYYSAQGEARHYLSIAKKAVFANRLNVGGIRPQGNVDLNVPFHKRLFLGGATSIRGWGRYEVSPLSGFGFPIGGLSMFEGSSEIRMPLRGKLGAVAFVDYGNVWLDSFSYKLGDLRYAVGPGLRYLTPIGPARIDLGYQVNPIQGLLVNGQPEKRRWRVHFSIGQAF